MIDEVCLTCRSRRLARCPARMTAVDLADAPASISCTAKDLQLVRDVFDAFAKSVTKAARLDDHGSDFIVRDSDKSLRVGIRACKPSRGVIDTIKSERVFLLVSMVHTTPFLPLLAREIYALKAAFPVAVAIDPGNLAPPMCR